MPADRVVIINQFGDIISDMKLGWEGKPNSLGTFSLFIWWGYILNAPILAYSPPDKLLGWSDKTFEIRSIITGDIEGVFRQKKASKVS